MRSIHYFNSSQENAFRSLLDQIRDDFWFFDPAEDPDLQPRAGLLFELRLDDDAVLLKCAAKQRSDHRYNLVFPEVFATKHGIYAPQPLRKIIKSLEPISLQ